MKSELDGAEYVFVDDDNERFGAVDIKIVTSYEHCNKELVRLAREVN